MFHVPGAPCHSPQMVSYVIVPRRRGYWIEGIDETVSRRTIERFDTEEMAIQRRRVLRANAGTVERRKDILHAKKPLIGRY